MPLVLCCLSGERLNLRRMLFGALQRPSDVNPEAHSAEHRTVAAGATASSVVGIPFGSVYSLT